MEQQVKLIKIQSPFDHRKRTVEFKDCTSLSLLDIRNNEAPLDVDFSVSINGIVVREEDYAITQIKPNDCIIFTPNIGDMGDVFRAVLIIAIVVGSLYVGNLAGVYVAGEMAAAEMAAAYAVGTMVEAAVIAATIYAGSMLVNAILPGARPPEIAGGDFNRSQTYSWNPVTTQQQGAAVPIVYGKHRVYGNIISGYIDAGEGISTDSSKLNLLLGLSMGPIKAITNITVNDQLSPTYPGLVIDTRLGYLAQSIISSFNGTKVTYISNREIKTATPYTYTTPDNDFDGLEIVLSLPKGIYYANDAGSLSSHSVEVSIEIRNVTTGESFRHVVFTSLLDLQIAAGFYWSFGLWVNDPISPEMSIERWLELQNGGTDPTAHKEGDTDPAIHVNASWKWIGPAIKLTTTTPLNYVTISSSKATAFTYTKRISGLAHGTYEIKITKVSADKDSVRYGDAVRLNSVLEVYNDKYSYPRLALAGIQALASDQISGGIKFSADVYGKLIRVYRADEVLGTDGKNYRCILAHTSGSNTRPITGGSWATYWEQTGHSALPLVDGNVGVAWVTSTAYSATESWRVEYSNNPAWIAFDILTQPVFNDNLTVNRYDAYNSTYLDVTTFQTWADYCDTLVDNGSSGLERRITFNGVFDSASNVWDSVLSICQMSYACPVWTGTTIKIITDQAKTSTQLFTIGNIIEDSFKEVFLSLSERAGELEIEFTDAEQDYERTTLTILDTTANRPSNKANKALFGITKSSEANRLGHRYLAYNKYQIRLIDFEADVDAIVCELGDRIDLSHDVPQWGFGGRIVSANSTTVTIDRTFTVADGKTGANYTIKLRLTDDTIVAKTLASSMTPGDYTVLTINGTFSTVPAQYDPYVVGLTAVVVKPAIVVGLRKASDQTIGITAVDYYDEVYNFEAGKVFTTALNYSSLNRLVVISNVTAKEWAHVDIETGVIVREIFIEFETSTNAIYKGAVVQVIERSASGSFVIANLTTSVRKVTFTKAKPSTEYLFIVQGMNASNEYSPESVVGDGNRVTITTTSDWEFVNGAFKGKVSGLQIVGEDANVTTFTGRDVSFKWRRTTITDYVKDAGNELHGAATSLPDVLFKNYRVQIYESNGTTKRGNVIITAEPIFTYSLAKNMEDGNGTPASSFVISVDAVNVFNEQTAHPAKLSVSNTVPPNITGLIGSLIAGGVEFKWDKCPDADLRAYYYRITIGSGTAEEWKDVENNFVYRSLTFAEISLYTMTCSITFEVKAKDWYNQYSEIAASSVILSDYISQEVLDLANRNWTQTCVFSVTDLDTVAWGAGTFTSANGVSYSISAGNTGNMIARTYVYLDIAISTIVYQVTTIAPHAVGAGKVLIATAVNGAVEAEFQVFNGIGGLNINGSNVVVGSISTTELADLAVSTAKVAANAITTAKIAALAVTAAEIAAATITGAKIAALTIETGNIAALSITTAKIAALAVTAAEIAAGAVTTAKIAALAVEAGNIAAGAVTTAKIAALAVTTANIAALAVTSNELAAGSVIAGKIAALTIVAADIAAGTITGAKIAAVTITAANIAALTITAAEIAAGTITGAKIAATTITASNIAALTITAAEIAAGTITGAKIAAVTIAAANIVAGTITATEIAAGTITGAKIAALTIETGNIAALSITTAKIAALAVTAAEIAANTITAAKIAAGTITTTQIAAATIVAGNIVAGTITGNEIAASTITSGKLSVAQLSAISADLGAITAGTITLPNTGWIKGGQTDYATGTGFFLGYSGAAYKFSIGDTTKYIKWDGAALTVRGTLNADDLTAGTLASARIAAGSLTAAQIGANEVVATTARIDALAVTTVKIADQAVTVPVSAYTAALITTGTTETTIQSAAITSTGAPIHIAISCLTNATSWYQIRIYRGATMIYDTVNNINYEVTGSMAISDTPGVGSFTYYLKGWMGVAGGGFSCRSILLLEVKR